MQVSLLIINRDKYMFEAYMKQVVMDGSGSFTVCKVQAETEDGLKQKRDMYLGDDWQDATAEEYTAQFAARTAPVEPGADAELGGTPVVAEALAPETTPEPEQTPAAVEPAPEAEQVVPAVEPES